MGSEAVVAGVELGGTKSIAVIGRGREILARYRVPTTTPGETLGALSRQLAAWRTEYRPRAIGIASFGPVSVREGVMLPTPKPHWAGADIVGPLAEGFGAVAFHTDVTGAALGEGRFGAGVGLSDFLYVTVGTGVGMGLIVGGRPVTGMMHPEAGHIRVRRSPGDDFAGACPFHGDCLEGLVSGPAIAARCGHGAHLLAVDDPRWIYIADALGEAFATLFLTLSPARIIVGGGVGLGQPHLLDLVRTRTVAALGGYLGYVDAGNIGERIVPAALGDEAGPLGTLVMAQDRIAAGPGAAG
ncbi:fructokinase [Sphingomonas sp. Leaf407]|uniref:ROK family protein n=1 Tax=unclassified Sphingomonas TaxID=196159 RepID=UPI0006FA554D|nr:MULTISPECIES: ROK family protein [unclassified Sphingomonas]KQN40638.1 fructokinase [Sphingomonas sp. Leaf42]KQT29994.1 fructokinase [Sphingomonas sp. Leaf407]